MSNSIIGNYQIEIASTLFIPAVSRWRYSHASIPTWRFYWNPSGVSRLFSRGQEVLLDRETVVIIPPNTPFSTEADKPFSHFYIHFTLTADLEPAEHQIQVFTAGEVIADKLIQNITSFSPRQLKQAAFSIAHAAMAILPDSFFVRKKPRESYTYFDKAVKIIHRDPAFSASCGELARLCGTTAVTLHRQFFKAAGATVKSWLLNYKMENAANMLLAEEYSIKEIADTLGYSDRYHFSKVFKKYFGVSPAQFKKNGGLPPAAVESGIN